MDTRNSKFIIYAVFAIAAVFPSSALSVPVQPYTYGGDFDLPIPALGDPQREYGRGWMADAIVEVPDHFTIYDLDVGVSLTHDSFFDLQIVLQSPAGTEVALNPSGNTAFIVRGEDGRLGPVGGSKKLVFDDEAVVPIEQAEAPFVGPFRPVEPYRLSEFNGEDAYGIWRLQIHDAFYAHTGRLDKIELIVTVPEPATAILLTLGAALLRLHKPRRNRKNI